MTTTSVSVERICDRIAELDEEITALESDLAAKQAAVAALRSLLPDEEEDEPEEEPEPKPKKPAARREPGNGQPPASAKPAGRASKYPPLIRELLLKEPLSQNGIARRLDVAPGCFSAQMQKHPWFEKIDGLWTLTEAGRSGS